MRSCWDGAVRERGQELRWLTRLPRRVHHVGAKYEASKPGLDVTDG